MALTVIKVVLAVLFLLAGGAKLAGAKPLAARFREFGLPRWAMPVLGALEVAGAIGLLFDPLLPWAVAGLAALMAGAVINHLKVRHPFSKVAPALVLFGLCLAIAGWHFRDHLNLHH